VPGSPSFHCLLDPWARPYCYQLDGPRLAGDGTLDASKRLLHIDQYLDGASAAAAPAPNPFCLTGCLRMGKSKFWEVVSRGEVWDNVLKHVISEATLDTALVIDPADEARELDPVPANRRPFAQYSSHVRFRRWYFDKYRGLMGRDY